MIGSLLKKIYKLRGVDFEFRKLKIKEHLFSQSIVSPQATYSPWLDDDFFMEFYEKVQGNTLVDIYRCFELWQLVKQVSNLSGSILEIGVWRGGSGCILGKSSNLYSSGTKVYLCDTFEGIVKASNAHDNIYRGGELNNTSMEIVQSLVRTTGLKNVIVKKGMFPDNETYAELKEQKFKLCHIDVDVYVGAKEITAWIWPRLEKNGIVVFDDFGFMNTQGVTKFVNEQMGLKDRMIIHNLNGHAIIIKL